MPFEGAAPYVSGWWAAAAFTEFLLILVLAGALAALRRTAARAPSGADLEQSVHERTLELFDATSSLEAQRRRLSALIDAIPDLVYFKDPQGRFQVVNEAFRRFAGKADQEIIGKAADAVLSPEFSGPCVAGDEAAVAAGRPLKVEEEVLTAVGPRFFTSTRIALRDPAGASQGVLAICREVTEEKALAAHLSHSEKLGVVGRLTSGIAHDFNNMLGVVRVTAEMLQDEAASHPKWAQGMGRILQASERATHLAGELLEFVRSKPSSPEPFDLHASVVSVTGLLRETLPKSIEIRTAFSAPCTRVRGARSEFESVLLNLALNARDAMPDGGKLAFETVDGSKDPPGSPADGAAQHPDWVEVRVRDTGMGMDESELARIFEPFYTSKPAGKGTGLGLSMARRFIEGMGGKISATSQAGGGAVFFITLPLACNPLAGGGAGCGMEQPSCEAQGWRASRNPG